MNRQQLPEQYPELPGPGQLGVQGTASPSGGGGGGGGGGGKGTGQKPQYAKRGKITIVACVPCRKRKTKVGRLARWIVKIILTCSFL